MGSIYYRTQWNIQTTVMALPSFRAQPRQGHMDQAKRRYGYYLKNTKHFQDRFQTDKPEYSDILDIPDYRDWRDTSFIYGHHAEELPTNTPKPLGKRVIITHYYYASLMHDVLSGKAVIHTGIFHYFYNTTPINSYSKKQASNNRNNNIWFGIFIL